MPLPWIKMWLEALDDPKLTRLSLAERGAWWSILQLAAKCEANGKINSGGEGLSLDEIADALHIKTPEDRQALESMIDKMVKRNSLAYNGDALTVIHWEERQRIPPSAQPEAIAARVRRYREHQKAEHPPFEKFETFWKAYPKRKSKGQAEKAFMKVNPNEQVFSIILAAIERAKKSIDWQKDDGKFIPYPATWLNAKGWEDEFQERGGQKVRRPGRLPSEEDLDQQAVDKGL